MFTFFGGSFLPSLPSSIKNNHLLKLGVAEAPVAVGVEPSEDLLDLLLRQVLRELSLLHLRLGDVAVLVLVVLLEHQLGLLLFKWGRFSRGRFRWGRFSWGLFSWGLLSFRQFIEKFARCFHFPLLI